MNAIWFTTTACTERRALPGLPTDAWKENQPGGHQPVYEFHARLNPSPGGFFDTPRQWRQCPQKSSPSGFKSALKIS
jgi:hypothetical protein